MISENKIRERIKELQCSLTSYEEMYSLTPDNYIGDVQRRKILMKCYNIESQLDALYYVLGKHYSYKHI